MGARPVSALTSQLVVRPASKADLADILEIERATFSDPWSAGSFAASLSAPDVYVDVAAEPDGRVVGYSVVRVVLDEGEVLNVAVREDQRGRGIGRILVTAAVADAVQKGAAALYLEVRVSNAAALGLYASLGFSEVGRRARYYTAPVEDALILRRVHPPRAMADGVATS